MLSKLSYLIKKQKGFTLIELLIAVSITAVIGSALVMTMTQLFSINSADNNRMEAVKQVENALHYINRDVQMAAADEITPSSGLLSDGLHLHWIDYTGDHTISSPQDNQVDYVLNANHDLARTHTVDGNATTTIVARDIDLSSDYSFDVMDGKIFTVNITASVEGYKSATESRTLQVKPRID